MAFRQKYAPNTKIGAVRGWCFAKDTLVTMADGTHRPIQDLQVGDHIWNFDATTVNTVEHVMNRRANTITSEFFGASDITSTPDHKFPIVSRILDGFDNRLRRWEWSEIQEKEIASVDSRRYVKAKGDGQDYLIKPFITGDVELTDDELRAYGYWLGDGTLSYDNRGYNGYKVSVCGGEKKKLYVDSLNIFSYLNSYDGLHNWRLSKTEHALLHQVIGKSRVAKGEKQCLLVFTPKQYRLIIEGYLKADGSKQNAVQTISATISQYLATSLALAGNAAGYQVGLQKYAQSTEQVILGRNVMCAPYIFMQTWTRLTDIGDRHKQIKHRNEGDNFVLTKKKLHYSSGEQVVYNVQTSGDHSYIANGIGVKNCLKFVDDAGKAPTRKPNARAALNVEINAKRLSTATPPVGLWVVGFLDLRAGAYAADDHVFLMKYLGSGKYEIHDSETNSGARAVYPNINAITAWFGAYSPKYVGWSTYCDGRQYVESYTPAPAKPSVKKAQTTNSTNVRMSPNLSARIARIAPKGEVFTYDKIVTGASVNGKNKWYHSTANHYVWQGNVKNI